MKARIKGTDKVIEVQRRYIPSLDGEGYVDEYGGCYPLDYFEELQKKVYECDVDWQAYRREVAKECMTSMMHILEEIDADATEVIEIGIRDLAGYAVQAADALIARLKEEEK